jgi:hypothetical protein
MQAYNTASATYDAAYNFAHEYSNGPADQNSALDLYMNFHNAFISHLKTINNYPNLAAYAPRDPTQVHNFKVFLQSFKNSNRDFEHIDVADYDEFIKLHNTLEPMCAPADPANLDGSLKLILQKSQFNNMVSVVDKIK